MQDYKKIFLIFFFSQKGDFQNQIQYKHENFEDIVLELHILTTTS